MAAVAAPSVELIVTDSAAVEIKKFLASEDDLPETAGLRVRVVPGGCSGNSYSAAVDDALGENDKLVYQEDDLRVVADRQSAPYLDGLEIDYSDDLVRSGFRLKHATDRHPGRRIRLLHQGGPVGEVVRTGPARSRLVAENPSGDRGIGIHADPK